MHLEAFGWALWFIIQPPLCIHSFYHPLYTSSSNAWDKYFLHYQQGISSFCLVVTVHNWISNLRFLFVLFVCKLWHEVFTTDEIKRIQSGLQVATGPGCMEVQTAVRRNLICGVRGIEPAYPSAGGTAAQGNTQGSCRLAPPCHFLASQDCGKDLRVRAVRLIIDGCESGFAGGQKLRPAWQWEGCVMCVRSLERAAPSTDLTSFRTHPQFLDLPMFHIGIIFSL